MGLICYIKGCEEYVIEYDHNIGKAYCLKHSPLVVAKDKEIAELKEQVIERGQIIKALEIRLKSFTETGKDVT